MELITDISELITAIRAKDYPAARVAVGKLLVAIGTMLGGKLPVFAGEALQTAVDDLEVEVEVLAGPAPPQAGGDLFKRLLALLLQLLPFILG